MCAFEVYYIYICFCVGLFVVPHISKCLAVFTLFDVRLKLSYLYQLCVYLTILVYLSLVVFNISFVNVSMNVITISVCVVYIPSYVPFKRAGLLASSIRH